MMSTVRVIAGKYKNARLEVPAVTHPMGERERGSVFNSLGERVVGARVLDVFAGSGALGVEALSRGAGGVVFVEKDKKARDIIKRNVASVANLQPQFFLTARQSPARHIAGNPAEPSDKQTNLSVASGIYVAVFAGENCSKKWGWQICPNAVGSPDRKFDIIFADPPYDNPQIEVVKNFIKFLAFTGVMVVSLPRELPVPEFEGLELVSDKTYARARILMYRRDMV